MSGLEIFADNLKELREERETAANYKRIIINAVNRSIPQHIKTIEAIKAGAGALHVYIFPTDSAFRHAQQKHLSIQELKGLKEETRAAISALAADITAA
jgi:tRNA G37 N-methylase Trm5